MKVVLASRSPRREQLLHRIFDEFEIITADCDERCDEALNAQQTVCELALRKATAVFAQLGEPENTLVIGCDTVVEHKQKILGKPDCRQQVINMLSDLSGDFSRVYSGIALIYNNHKIVDFACTGVHFDSISADEISRYADTDEPYDKAGGYAVQGWAGKYINRIDGCYYNVVGLPLSLLRKDIDKILEETV